MRKKELREMIVKQKEGLLTCFEQKQELHRKIISWHSKWVKLDNYLASFGELIQLSELAEKMREIQNE